MLATAIEIYRRLPCVFVLFSASLRALSLPSPSFRPRRSCALTAHPISLQHEDEGCTDEGKDKVGDVSEKDDGDENDEGKMGEEKGS